MDEARAQLVEREVLDLVRLLLREPRRSARRRTFLKLCRQWHPDKNPEEERELASRIFLQLKLTPAL